MRLPILNTLEATDITHFIEYWSALYYFQNEEIYHNTITKSFFTEEDIINLFEWKNGMPLKGSGHKESSLKNKILPYIVRINSFKGDVIQEEEFLKDFEKLSAVWKIFLLHIIQPQQYPIYDQHIHRTYCFLNHMDWGKISNTLSDKKKEKFYFKTYRPFVLSLNYKNIKEIDNAFFAFGQFLNTKRHKTIFKS